MKIKIFCIAFSIVFLSFKTNAGQVKIFVSNIVDEKGTIHYGVYNDEDNFLNEEGKIIGGFKKVIDVKKNGLLIENLEESNYAIAIYHDKNSNKKFDKFLAIPVEMYGFSNNAKVFLGPPKFSDAAFFLGKEDLVELKIELK